MPSFVELAPLLLRGLQVTLVLTLGGSLLAVVCAVLAGLGRLSSDPIVRGYARVYVEVFRGTSALVQLFWFYFVLPIVLGVSPPAVVMGILVLGLNIGAYGAEVVRSAIEAVPAGQTQAAIALNLSRWQRMRYVIFPQALRLMLPSFGNLLIELLKSTALVSMISLTDLMRAGLFVRDDTLLSAQVFGGLLVAYFLLSMCITSVFRWAESRLSLDNT